PPLRERPREIPLLAERFNAEVSEQVQKSPPTLSAAVKSALDGYDWPGNIRELRNVINGAVMQCDGDELALDHLPAEIGARASEEEAELADDPDSGGYVAGSTHIALSDDASTIYVGSPLEHAITVFARDAVTGELLHLQTLRDGVDGIDGLAGVGELVIRDGTLYAVGQGDDALALFAIQADGSLQPRDVLRDTPAVNVARLGVASQSSTDFGGDAQRAIDGNTNPAFSGGSVTHTQSQANSYWEVQLDQIYALESVYLYNRGEGNSDLHERLSNFRVSVFNGSDEVFGQDYFGGGFVAPAGSFRVALPSGTGGDRVRIQLNGNNNEGNGYLSLAEVEVFSRSVEGLQDVNAITISEDGQRLYAAASSDPSSGTVSVFHRAADGSLTSNPVRFDRATAVAASPDDRYVYTVSSESNTLQVLRPATSTGGGLTELVQTVVLPVPADLTSAQPSLIKLSPNGSEIYVAGKYSGQFYSFERDTESGEVTLQQAEDARFSTTDAPNVFVIRDIATSGNG
ncbi:MAG: beta-propeller fold lactonase family protein, partial [Planctomycetes bacterium]|nr:beta-propeller fold lactonase family protein [Planctomycetota bacterium]